MNRAEILGGVFDKRLCDGKPPARSDCCFAHHHRLRLGYSVQISPPGDKILPVAAHVDLLCAQFLASALRVGHPSHAVVTADPGPRITKPTLCTKYIDVVAPYLSNGVINPNDYKSILVALHTAAVTKSIANLGINHLLGTIPPEICDSEKSLCRRERTLLAQLRADDCICILSYLVKIGRATSAICPECCFRRHTTSHLFNCEARPTSLRVIDLWTHPVAVIHFLKSLPSFLSVLSPEPPPPHPPPEPPPG